MKKNHNPLPWVNFRLNERQSDELGDAVFIHDIVKAEDNIVSLRTQIPPHPFAAFF